MQQFFDFLPGWAGGLGLQANYTYIDSETPSSTLGAHVPLQNLSRHSANLLRTRRSAYYGEPTRPQSVWLNDRQIGLTASLRF